MTHFLHSQSDLADALAQLIVADPGLAPMLEKTGEPALRRGEPGFSGLARIICGQQLSTASAGAIWARLKEAFDPFHHDALRRARADRLGRLGLSAAKIKSIKAIATEIAKGNLDLDHIAQSDADTAHQMLIAMHGIGPWTADIYLLFCLGHADAWPAGDLALQESARIAFNLKARPTTKEMITIGDAWRPFRGVAAHLLWAHYHVVKRREGAPVPDKPSPAKKQIQAVASAEKSSNKKSTNKKSNPKKKVTRNGRTERTKS
ncbi:DNA-3-methyladenine glycosylase family protein [Pseudorhodoplanes sinuspersici]|uniref:DNA-3-methyladenine glycosylase II n=1 Tax=Pseudorhodoplanes sinuspersici TaxID=1235591 RepID=A0A1W6ZQK9_9HYPH|nr:DNA-3-methyladenine glycosylase [Pseudorhodoplanes sinuspersici]ARP99698.1 DNA-3-methyladenine glycosidase [Pseudorhodoplanes sinuspersici]RKE70681.1 DNA-3-methyladenine glycosylase II [Pseudorhodoplanes sinuspersici]